MRSYIEIANREGYDAVITISNEFVSPSAPHPIQLPARHLRGIALHHWSWSHILTTALILKKRHSVVDPEQSWILNELIRYLEDERSGTLASDGLGADWVEVRDGARQGTLDRRDRHVKDTVAYWDQLLRYLALFLGRELGTDVDVVSTREERRHPEKRAAEMVRELVEESILTGSLRIPDAAADMEVSVDIRARQLVANASIRAPQTGRSTTRVAWMLRQLKAAPDDTIVTADYGHRRSMTERLDKLAADRKLLAWSADARLEARSFAARVQRPMRDASGRGPRSLVGALEALVVEFYSDVLQHMAAWVAPAPKIKPKSEFVPKEAASAVASEPPRPSSSILPARLPDRQEPNPFAGP